VEQVQGKNNVCRSHTCCRDLVNEYERESEINQIYSLLLIVTNYCVIYCRRLFASPHGPLFSTANHPLCHFRSWAIGYDSRRRSQFCRKSHRESPEFFSLISIKSGTLVPGAQLSVSRFYVALRRGRVRTCFLSHFRWGQTKVCYKDGNSAESREN